MNSHRVLTERLDDDDATSGIFDAIESEQEDGGDAPEARDPLKLYVKQVSSGGLLTWVQERELARRKDEGDEEAKKKLIASNLRLVMSITRSYARADVPLLDLIQEGNLGLIRAVEKFDYRMGFKLSTYASWWIRESIRRALVAQGRAIRLPLHVAGELRRVRGAQSSLTPKLGRDPTIAEIAAHTGIQEGRVRMLMELVETPVSLETLTGDAESTPGDVIEDTNTASPEATLDDRLRREALAEAIRQLDPQMRRVLTLRFGLQGRAQRTLEEVSSEIGLSRERVRQIEHRALAQLGSIAPHLRAHLES